MRREEIVALLIVLLLILPITNWYLPCFPSSLFKKLRKSFFLIHVRADLGACTHSHYFPGISVIRKATSLWKFSQCCYINIGWYQSLRIFWNCPSQTCQRLLCTLCFRSCGSHVQQFHYFQCLASSLPSHGFLTFYRFWMNSAKTYQQKGAPLSWSNTSI